MDVEVQIADVPAPRKRGRPPGSRNTPPVSKMSPAKKTVEVKQAPARKPAPELLDRQDIIDLVTTPHNILSKIFKLESLAIDDDAVAPYAADIASSVNKSVPKAAKQVKSKLPWLSVLAFAGLVEAPTLINTYDEIRAKRVKQPLTMVPNNQPNDNQMTAPPAPPAPEQPATLSQLDRLNIVSRQISTPGES